MPRMVEKVGQSARREESRRMHPYLKDKKRYKASQKAEKEREGR